MLTLCLDIGGTKIAAGLADPGGTLVHTATRPTPGQRARACLAMAANRGSTWAAYASYSSSVTPGRPSA